MKTNYILKLCKNYKLYFFILFALAIIASFFSISIEYQVKEIIDSIESHNIKNLYTSLIIFIALKFLYHFCHWIYRINDIIYKPKILRKIVQNSYEQIGKHSLHWFDSNFSGSITSKISDIQSNFLTIISNFFRLTRATMKIIFGLCLLYLAHKYLFYYSLILCIVYGIILIPLTKKMMELQDIYTHNRQKTIGVLNDIISNIFLVKIISKIKKEFEFKLKPNLDDWVDYEIKTRKFDTYFVDSLQTIFSTVFLCQSFLAVYLYLNSQISLGYLLVAINLGFNNSELVEELVETISFEINPKLASLRTSTKILDDSLNFNDKENAKVLSNVKGEIEFRNVDFGYNEHKNIFENLSIKINAGEKIGIVGPSGSGKTTFIKCLLRYFDIKNGEILVDGNDIRDITQESLYENISIIQQDNSVFHRTILENLQVANYEATFEEIVEVCKKAQIHDDIIKMKDQYNSIVGERGVKLSGGQRQRIAIARAILKNAPILILDEATSALDSVVEHEIQESLNLLMTGKTTIVIAHRLSTLLNMDRILVFDNGKIVEDGSHEELLAKNGRYRELWDAQVGGFLPENRN